MAYYTHETIGDAPVLGPRRPTINEFYLSSYNLNIYHGCELGCPYCDGWATMQRPLSETIRVPVDLPQQLARDLQAVSRGDLISITALSDPYQPAEQHYRITRQVLQLFAERGQPCLIMTKSPDVLQDITILQRIHERSVAVVMTTLITVDPFLAAKLEAKSPPPGVRLNMLSELKRAGIPVGVAIVPIMPYVNDLDQSLRALLRACAEIGVDFVLWDYLHIPNERHRIRVTEVMQRIASYPTRYLRDLYGDQPVVSNEYRQERDAELLARCDGLGLHVRAPQHIYEGRLLPRNELALLLKAAAFRDRIQNRQRVAELHRTLAEAVYRGEASVADLQRSPLWPGLRGIAERLENRK
jgi:DNA repair photolyase